MQTVWILGDQLSHATSALVAAERRGHRTVLMIESKARGSYLRYHQQKLVLIYSAMRHFAEELRAAGWEVDYHRLEETPTFEAGLRRHIAKFQPEAFLLTEPSDFLMADVLRKIGRKFRVSVELFPGTQFFLSREEFSLWAGKRHWLVMEIHYRELRKRTGYLIEADDKPTGGAWNFDFEDRHTFQDWERAGKPRSQRPVRHKPDAITQEVIAQVERIFPDHPGTARKFWLPVDRAGALQWLQQFVEERLECFGPYEDLAATDEVIFFHSVLSPMLNLGLISPQEVCEAALMAFEEGHAPLHSVEGFIRQIIGWREFVNGVYWHRGPEYKTLNALRATRPLPEWFKNGDTSLRCLRSAIQTALELGWNNRSQRLLVLGNFLLIAAIRPSEVLQWYSEMTVDAYDWAMTANVIGNVLYADGGYVASKPPAATAADINRMSDYCRSCQFKPELDSGSDACPFNYLYWNFIDRHTKRFAGNQGMKKAVQAWAKRPESEKEAIRVSTKAFMDEHVPM